MPKNSSPPLPSIGRSLRFGITLEDLRYRSSNKHLAKHVVLATLSQKHLWNGKQNTVGSCTCFTPLARLLISFDDNGVRDATSDWTGPSLHDAVGFLEVKLLEEQRDAFVTWWFLGCQAFQRWVFLGSGLISNKRGSKYPFSEELKTWNVTWSSLACSIDLIREKTCLIPCQAYLPRLLIPMVLLRCPHKMPDSSDTQICWEEIKTTGGWALNKLMVLNFVHTDYTIEN